MLSDLTIDLEVRAAVRSEGLSEEIVLQRSGKKHKNARTWRMLDDFGPIFDGFQWIPGLRPVEDPVF